MDVKKYTRDELAKSLVELYEGDPAGLATLVIKMNEWIASGMRVVEYRNGMLSPMSYFDRRYRAYAVGEEIPREIADSQGLSAHYRLEATYTQTGVDWILDLPAMLRVLNFPRPAVAYIDAGYDVNGNSRRGFAIYREQGLIEFVPKDDGQYYKERLEQLGADESWATGEIKVSEEVWEEITNEDNWPTTSRKFSSHRAERLYGYTLESGQDEDLGDSDWGWYALFKSEEAILNVDSQGSVSVEVYKDNDEEMTREWERISEEWEQYNEDDEEE